MQQYLSLMQHVRDTGTRRPDRTRIGTLPGVGHQMRSDLTLGRPRIPTYTLDTRAIIASAF